MSRAFPGAERLTCPSPAVGKEEKQRRGCAGGGHRKGGGSAECLENGTADERSSMLSASGPHSAWLAHVRLGPSSISSPSGSGSRTPGNFTTRPLRNGIPLRRFPPETRGIHLSALGRHRAGHALLTTGPQSGMVRRPQSGSHGYRGPVRWRHGR